MSERGAARLDQVVGTDGTCDADGCETACPFDKMTVSATFTETVVCCSTDCLRDSVSESDELGVITIHDPQYHIFDVGGRGTSITVGVGTGHEFHDKLDEIDAKCATTRIGSEQQGGDGA